jgi:hypothetical protein
VTRAAPLLFVLLSACGGVQAGKPVSAERVATARAIAQPPRVNHPPVGGTGATERSASTVAPRTTASAMTPPASKPSVGPALALGVLAAGGIGTGIALEVMASSNKSSASGLQAMLTANQGGCTPLVNHDSLLVCPELQSKLNAANTFRAAAAGPFIAGGAAAVSTAIYLLWPAPPPESKRSVGPAVALGVLAAGAIGAGVAFQVASSSTNSSASALAASITANRGGCNPLYASYDFIFCPVLQDRITASSSFEGAAVGAFIVGGAAAAGTALYLLWPSQGATTAGLAAPPELRLTPLFGRAGNELVVSGQF